MLEATAEPVIRYEYPAIPESGGAREIEPGVVWLRMPLPFALDHINLWLLADRGGWVIVDTGAGTDDSRAIWDRTLNRFVGRAPVERVIVTHLHPDHVGNAGWLCDRLGATLWMTREEYMLCRVLVADTGRPAPAEGKAFYHGAGFPPEAMQRYEKMFGMFGRYVASMPESYRRIKDRDRIEIGDRSWEIVVGRGHSPEHACLFDEKNNVLIAGDQLLPTISSNIGVYPTEPEADPLADWLSSLKQVETRVPDDVLVLPAHGRPFRGAHARLEQLQREHETALSKLLDMCREPQRAVDVFPALFRSRVRESTYVMAAGESIAHLNYLRNQGRIERTTDGDGVHWYRSTT